MSLAFSPLQTIEGPAPPSKRLRESVPFELLDEFRDEMSLVGLVARSRERYHAWAECGISALTVVTEQPEAMELMASLAR